MREQRERLETEVISRILMGNGSSVADADLNPDDLSVPAGKILTACREIFAGGELFEPPVVMAKLPGMAGAISKYLASATTAANVGFYVAELKKEILIDNKARLIQEIVSDIKCGRDPEKTISDGLVQIECMEASYSSGFAPKTLAESAYALMEQIETGMVMSSMPTGFRAIDSIITGLLPGDMMVIAARPSMGKTSLGIGIIGKLAQAGRKSAFFSLEQTARTVSARILAETSRTSTKIALRNPAGLSEYAKTGLLDGTAKLLFIAGNVFIFDRPNQSLAEVAAGAKNAVKNGAECLFLDYLQLMKVPKKEREDTEISANAEGLRALGKTLGVPVVVLAQLNRECEKGGRRPRLSDLRGSGGIEQAADFVVFIHCSEEEEKKSGRKTIIVGKGRDTGIGVSALHFDAETASFHDLEE